jgi:hypothetical protein
MEMESAMTNVDLTLRVNLPLNTYIITATIKLLILIESKAEMNSLGEYMKVASMMTIVYLTRRILFSRNYLLSHNYIDENNRFTKINTYKPPSGYIRKH